MPSPTPLYYDDKDNSHITFHVPSPLDSVDIRIDLSEDRIFDSSITLDTSRLLFKSSNKYG